MRAPDGHGPPVIAVGNAAAELQARKSEVVASVAGAYLGAAQRFVRDHASLADAELKRLAAKAAAVSQALPEDLHLLWLLHYVEGYPLSVYATATGMTTEAALDDYRGIIRALSTAMHDQTKGARQ